MVFWPTDENMSRENVCAQLPRIHIYMNYLCIFQDLSNQSY